MRFLVVDDSYEDRSLVERVLKRKGYRSTCVSSGMKAVEALYAERFDVALVDLGMPGMTGQELIPLLRSAAPEMRVLVVSSFDDRKNVLSALQAGADGYVLKTELGEKLGPALQEVIAGQSPMSGAVGAILLKHLRAKMETEEVVEMIADEPGDPPLKASDLFPDEISPDEFGTDEPNSRSPGKRPTLQGMPKVTLARIKLRDPRDPQV
jgi:DNA-binding NarL/FixJ family response regulator